MTASRFHLGLMLTALVAIAGCRPGALAPADQQWEAGTARHTITVGGRDRSFLLHIPPRRPVNRFRVLPTAYPLVVVLHGSGANGESVRAQSHMDEIADSLRFLVAYPNATGGLFGLGSDWNAGTCCGAAARNDVDDVAFVRATIAEITRRLPVDHRRVFVAGFSDGGRMAYHLACTAARQIAAIAVVSGSLVDPSCAPARPVPLIAFHGTGDSEVAYTDSALTPPPTRPVAASAGLPPAVRFWSAVDGCSGLATTNIAPEIARTAFRGCRADVVLYTIAGGRHAWPGSARDGSSGNDAAEINASELIARFFLRHPRR